MERGGLRLLTWDVESTGVDTENDRIISCFMRAKDGDQVVFEKNWILDPGVDVPEEASDVHGMTTEWLRENGRKDVAEAIREISEELHLWGAHHTADNCIIAGYNNSYDLGILDAESRRHLDGEEVVLDGALFLDPVHFSRELDRFKKGGHKLIDVAKRNGLKIEEERLHAADYDTEVTEKLVPIFLNRAWTELKSERAGLTPDEFIVKLQVLQAKWNKEWAEGLTDYFAKSGKKDEDGSPIVVEAKFPY